MQLSKAKIAGLNDQELDAYARIVLDESRYRRAKLDRAKNYRGRQIIPVVIIFLATGALFLSSMLGWEAVIVFFAAMTLMQWHTSGLNKRIDSLIDLLELNSITNRAKDSVGEVADQYILNQAERFVPDQPLQAPLPR